MKPAKSQSVTLKLGFAFVVLIAILLGIGWLGLSRMALMNGNIQEITDQCWLKVQLSREALRYSSLNSRITMQIFLLQDRNVIDPLLDQRAKNTEKISELLKQIETDLKSDAEKALIARVWTARNPYVESYKRALNLLLNEGQPEAGRKMMAEVVTPNLIAYHKAWEAFVEYQGERMDQAGAAAEAHYTSARRQVVTLLALSLSLACAVAVFVTRGTTREVTSRLQAEESLREAHAALERRVEQRTAELSNANSALTIAHQEVKAGEHRLRVILETQPECVKQVAADGTLLAMNRAGLCLVEAEKLEEVVGRSVYDLVAPEYQAMFQALNEAIFRGASEVAEFEIIGLKGTRRWMQTHACPLRNLEGNIIAQLAVTRDITERKRSEAELEKAHKELMETSRTAGMAEVATSVLHNVGNVLNSVSVSAEMVAEKLRRSKAPKLAKAASLLKGQNGSLAFFLTEDPNGRKMPGYLEKLGEHLISENSTLLREVDQLGRNIEHIKEIVTMQQSYAKVSGAFEILPPDQLVEDAIAMNYGAFERHGVSVERRFSPAPPARVDRHKVLQILINLLRNAKYALDEVERLDKRITISIEPVGEHVRIAIADNGIGIPPENLDRIFGHGFTTRKDGHGFGLHSGANAAREIGGTLSVHSDGLGLGTTFTLELPAAGPSANA